jgi:predicted N-acyltransferase
MEIKQISRIDDVSSQCWNALAGDGYPFMRHEFLSALENSGCASAKTGWFPCHLIVQDRGELSAAMPMYLKTHSQGEYVFDTQWAYAAGHYGQQYYPKCLTAIPFTPCQGSRILIDKQYEPLEIMGLLVEYLKQTAKKNRYSSWHCLFPSESQLKHLQKLGLMVREGIQFHWYNRDYRSFDDFLSGLTSRKRKMIRRERSRVAEQGIELQQIRGSQVNDEQWGAFFEFYRMTYYKNGMPPYLTLEFFQRCAAEIGDTMLLVLALKDGKYVGAALSFRGRDTLYGRYWGCLDEYHSLHFETCFYQGVDYCIANGLQHFDSGAQGEHKIARGFEPVATYSVHWLRDPHFREAVKRFLIREKNTMQQYRQDAEIYLPYK